MFSKLVPLHQSPVTPSVSKVLSVSLLTGCLFVGSSKGFAQSTPEGEIRIQPQAEKSGSTNTFGIENLKSLRTSLKELESILNPLIELDQKSPGGITNWAGIKELRENIELYTTLFISAQKLDHFEAPARKGAKIVTSSLVIALNELNETFSPKLINSRWTGTEVGKKESAGLKAANLALKELKALSSTCFTEIATRQIEASKGTK